MSNGEFNYTANKDHTYDAIVIGSGISGGWAAKELCEGGLKTLVLERGKNVVHLKDYPTATKNPWEFEHHGYNTLKIEEENPVVSKCYAFDESTHHFFVKDKQHPYIQEKPFDWIRGYQVGGKSLLWARQTQRWSRFDFEGPARDNYAVDWPIRYDDLAPWYSHVETFAGISGNHDGLETLPDGEFLPPWEMNAVEKTIKERIMANYKDRNVIIGRCAHLTQPKEIHLEQGRGQCQARNLCQRGCPFGGYFSSNSSTLPTANKTGNLTIIPNSVVHSIIYDDQKGKATGVKVIDAETKQATEYYARIIFVNAAALNTNLILLNSKSARFPNGLGNDNGLLGKFIAFQNYRGYINATFDGPEDKYYYGRRPTAVMMPNFRNVHQQETDFKRGYMVFYTATRAGWGHETGGAQIGAAYKDAVSEPGGWDIYMMMQGETIPKETNHVFLSKDQKDDWGVPLLTVSVDYDENDEKLKDDFLKQGAEMLEKAGCKNISPGDNHWNPGLDIHEVGGVRMGKDPKTSLLNKWNQFHNCTNVFVTDGACMTSTGVQNPSLTFMALTARAAAHAIDEFKKGNL
ncbi:GMC oxidoreductase [Mucilaginibacter gotjawali]|uniref:Choline dehydrogenase-like flavoprotein n=2 Tax=Mucilaginibacter gotjawali TaxID=1550579 RepID=A0A839SE21_9SPHI|nr:GMC family oxidoreductase [Mucilaginibacter gotjawali]MBB3055808.1 choline dehydrogenase-like flavoprotein [Mucilaginibacter gotjawali]BAU54629.1 Fructose dehydrogenase large subunit [Mucilaginibacter gotjawali]